MCDARACSLAYARPRPLRHNSRLDKKRRRAGHRRCTCHRPPTEFHPPSRGSSCPFGIASGGTSYAAAGSARARLTRSRKKMQSSPVSESHLFVHDDLQKTPKTHPRNSSQNNESRRHRGGQIGRSRRRAAARDLLPRTIRDGSRKSTVRLVQLSCTRVRVAHDGRAQAAGIQTTCGACPGRRAEAAAALARASTAARSSGVPARTASARRRQPLPGRTRRRRHAWPGPRRALTIAARWTTRVRPRSRQQGER